MKKFWAAAVLLAIALVSIFVFETDFRAPEGSVASTPLAESSNSSPSGTGSETGSGIPPAAPDENISTGLATHAVAPDSTQVAGAIPEIPAAIVLENVSRAIQQFGAMFGGNPVGTNPEITAALNGGNPRQINFIRPEAGMRINEKGEMVDAWGTPLFFHQVSGSETEVRSAGPDRIMWTQDDVIAK